MSLSIGQIPNPATVVSLAAAQTAVAPAVGGVAATAIAPLSPVTDEFAAAGVPQAPPSLGAPVSILLRDGNGVGGDKGSPINLEVAAEWLLKKMEDQYGFYGEDHPLSVYMNGLAARLGVRGGRQPRVYVTRSWDEINACALPNGAIVVSDRLIEFCKYEEELLFLLSHESEHVAGKHSARRIEMLVEIFGKRGGRIEGFLSAIGQARFFEVYEGDIKGVVDMAEAGVNPYGGTVFFTRLQGIERDKDIEHGSSIDRTLNIGLATRFYDLAFLTTNLTPIPADTIAAVAQHKQSDYQVLVSEGYDERERRVISERHDRARTATFHVLLEALPVLTGRTYWGHLGNGTTDHLRRIRLDEDRKVIRTILGRIKRHIDAEFAALPASTRKDILAIVIMAGTDAHLMQASGDENPLAQIADEFADSLDSAEDFRRLARSVSPAIFERLGIYLSSNPKDFLEAVIRMALETDGFGTRGGGFNARAYFRFCIDWIDRVEALVAQRGPEKLDRHDAFLDLVILGIPNVKKGEEKTYLEAATGLAIPLMVKDVEKKVAEAREGEKRRVRTPEDVDHDIKRYEKAVTAFLERLRGRSRVEIEEALREFLHGDDEDPEGMVAGVLGGLIGDELGILTGMTPIARLKWALSFAGELGLDPPPDGWSENDSAECVGDIIEVHAILERYFESNYEELEEFFVFAFGNFLRFSETHTKTELIAAFREFSDAVEIGTPSLGRVYIHGFLNNVFSRYQFDLSSMDELKFLFDISFLFADPSVAMRFRKMLAERILALCSADEAFDFLFTSPRYRRGTSFGTKEGYVDQHVNTLENMGKLERAVMDVAANPPYAEAGKLVVIDVIEEHFKGKRKTFQVLMNTRRDERELRKALYTADARGTDLFKADAGKDLNPEDIAYAMMRTDQRMRSLYTLDPLARHALVRALLVGERGLLRSTVDRSWLMDYLFTSVVREAPDESGVAGVLREGLAELMETADLETLFFAIAPLVEARILKPPARAADWRGIIGGGKKRVPKRAMEVYEQGQYNDQGDLRLEGEDEYTTKESFGYLRTVEQMIVGDEPELVEEMISPLGLVVEVASKLGSPGVRFLQVLGQFVSLPAGYEPQFARVYDGLRGQTKLTAYLLLKREWPELADEIAEIHAPVGGGSLMTTFRVRTRDGRDEVVKMLNPNAEYHLDIVYGMLEKVIGNLARRNGGGYAMAHAALADIKEWIARDIRFEGFLERDRAFRAAHHGFTRGGRYSVMVPESHGPESRYFKREEYVDGTNLTQVTRLAEEGHDLREIVALIAANYFQQIQTGLVHADVHPGNFRVTRDGRVAILDRNFFIELDERDQTLIQGLIASFMDAAGIAHVVSDYFGLDRESRAAKTIAEIAAGEGDAMEKVKQIVIHLKEHGIHVPLKITLLIKNINGLASLARTARFGNLQEAFFYSMSSGR